MTNSQSPDRTALADERNKLLERATLAAAGIDLLQDSMSLRRRTAEIINELVAALRSPSPYSGAADEAQRIVTDWLGLFDPPPQIDFQQSEFLQQGITKVLEHFSATTLPRDAVEQIFNGWLERFEHGDPILHTPAREYAADAVRDCRDAVLALLAPRDAERETIEALQIAAEYEAGTAKAVATGYEEFGPAFQRQRQIIIDALRFYAGHINSGAAMREPTEAMLDAARDWSREKYGKPIGNDGAIGCWQAMLAALPSIPSREGVTCDPKSILQAHDKLVATIKGEA